MFFDLLKSRRSIRDFQDTKVEKEKIDAILKSALLSPSSRGIKPWEFIALTDKELLVKLSKAKETGSAFLSNAPLGIVVIADATKSDAWVEDTSISAVITQLSAQALGLRSCWIQIRNRPHDGTAKAGEYIKAILGIPPKYEVECMIAIGYPKEEKKAHTEDELLYDKLHYNTY